MVTVVVFDLDDTLYPEEAFACSALAAAGRHASAAHGIAGMEAELLGHWARGHRKELFQQAYRSLGRGELPASLGANLLKAYREHRPESLPWFPDARDVVGRLHARHALELISDGFLPTQANKFHALGAGIWIPNPIFTESLGREHWKPSPKAFEMVMSRHPIGTRFVYVADNPSKDFVAPRTLGWQAIRVARPSGVYHAAAVHPEGPPHITIEDLTSLPDLLS